MWRDVLLVVSAVGAVIAAAAAMGALLIATQLSSRVDNIHANLLGADQGIYRVVDGLGLRAFNGYSPSIDLPQTVEDINSSVLRIERLVER